MTRNPHRVVIGVTTPLSLMLMEGLPQRLVAEGWEVHVVSSPGTGLDELRADGTITVHAIQMVREPSFRADVAALMEWWRLLRRVRPTVVFVGTPKAAMLGVIAGFFARVPRRVYHVRGLRLETSNGMARVVYAMLERLVLATATSALVVSHSLKERLITLRLARADKLYVLGAGSSNGVDLQRFSGDLVAEGSAKLALKSHLPTIGFVGRLHRDKGMDSLIDASVTIARRGVAHRLLVVGGSDDDSYGLIAQRLAELSPPAIVVGAVADTRPYYGAMDVLCLPTLREGFPNVVLEAAATGVPSVVSDATGAVDSVVDGVTGTIVPLGDINSLADALQRMLTQPEWRTTLGTAARQRAEDLFDRRIVQSRVASYLRAIVTEVDR